MVRSAMADGSDLSRGTCSFGSGDAATMVGPCHLAHHPCTACSLFSGHSLCSSVAPRSAFACSSGGLVYQSSSHFFRYVGLRSSASVASDTFLSVACQTRYDRNSASSFRAPHSDARLCGMIWLKSSLVPIRITPHLFSVMRSCL